MRANTITTIPRPRSTTRQMLAVIAVGAALAIPASATGSSPSPDRVLGYGGVPNGSAVSGSPDRVLRYGGSISAGPVVSSSPSPGIAGRSPDRVLAYGGLPGGTAALVSGPPAGTSGGFDWDSAAIGAGVVLALLALGRSTFLTVRRRTAPSPALTR